jgi:hypothetical protein
MRKTHRSQICQLEVKLALEEHRVHKFPSFQLTVKKVTICSMVEVEGSFNRIYTKKLNPNRVLSKKLQCSKDTSNKDNSK